ncbi:AurF N-oxygenase family protein [Kutzneria albida]|uniref:p-aminobenzoate N-oxygenase AurF n=1 Tax=Kutzneria albida DSM 43870 TaxID=1449976 RepID=W5W5S3_9PSEU|nr:diiron oxygenase [Kutzneria albida]AHH96568.1 hypothetical protein KALB_3201 [Kutzneria albida DSM 43870]
MTTAPDRERVAQRLQRSSARNSYDPEVDIDWSAPIPADRYAKPPQRCSLYGTRMWEELTEPERIRLSQQEVVSSVSSGIWFELILMQGLVRHVYNSDPTSEHAQYALTEIADECRHSTMFGKAIAKMYGKPIGPSRVSRRAGRVFGALAGPTLIFAGALFVEELADGMQREIMRDDTLQPLSRMVSRIHVTEEARHISYAKDELVRACAGLSRFQRANLKLWLAAMAYTATQEFIHPKTYATVGLDPRVAWQVAKDNPHWQATKIQWVRKAVALFEELDLIDGPGRRLWLAAGLLER